MSTKPKPGKVAQFPKAKSLEEVISALETVPDEQVEEMLKVKRLGMDYMGKCFFKVLFKYESGIFQERTLLKKLSDRWVDETKDRATFEELLELTNTDRAFWAELIADYAVSGREGDGDYIFCLDAFADGFCNHANKVLFELEELELNPANLIRLGSI